MRTLVTAVIGLSALAAPVAAQEHAAAPTEGLRAEMIRDVQDLQEKFMGLAKAMSGKYDWRPADGVRSVGEVFGHVADANFMFPGMAGVEGGMGGQDLEHAADDASLMAGLEHSFMHARESIARVPDAELDAQVTMFGQPATKRQVLTLMVAHMHEHLGQSIAYARMNGVTPPWSAGGE